MPAEGHDERDAEPDDAAAQEGAPVAVGGAQPAEEGRRAVGAGDHGLGQREQQHAAEEARPEREGAGQRHDARHRQDGGAHGHDGHEHAPVDEALGGAGVPLAVGRGIGGGRAVQRVDGEARDDVDDGPEARLGGGRGRHRDDGLDGRGRAEQHREVGQVGRHGGVQRRAEQQRVEAPVAVEAARHEEAADPQADLAEGEEREAAPHDEGHGLGQADAGGGRAPEVVHHPAVADRQDEVEQQRQEQQRRALAQRRVAARCDDQRHAGRDVDQGGEGASRGGQPEHVEPPRRQLPHREGGIPRRREERQHDGVAGDRDGPVGQAGQRAGQHEAAGAEAGRERYREEAGQGGHRRQQGGEQEDGGAGLLGRAGGTVRDGRRRRRGHRCH